jgi:hypothetical protein
MQQDPFSALQESLDAVFLQEAMRNGKFAYPPVQNLKEAVDAYDPQNKFTFFHLVKAVIMAWDFVQKRVPIEQVLNQLNALAKCHQLAALDWNRLAPKGSGRFSLSNSLAQKETLDAWLSAKCQRDFNRLKDFEKIQVLVDHCDDCGFSQKLSDHLNKKPDFLFDLIQKSPRSFAKIASCRLNLYLTDAQLATAIVHHLPHLVQPKEDSVQEVEELVTTINGILSNGRSLSTLLHNKEAKPILDKAIHFRIYQSEEYQNKSGPKPEFS